MNTNISTNQSIRNKSAIAFERTLRRRKIARIVMLVDLILVALIFAYITNKTDNSPYNFGKPASVIIKGYHYMLSASYLKDLRIFSLHATVEKTGKGSKTIKTGKSLPGRRFILELKFSNMQIAKRSFALKKNWNFNQINLFSAEVSESKIQDLFRQYSDAVTPAKDNSFISFDSDKIIAELYLYLDNKNILTKKLTFHKRKLTAN